MAWLQSSWTLRFRLDGMMAVVPREASQARRSFCHSPLRRSSGQGLSPTSSADGGMAAMQALATVMSWTFPEVIINTQGWPFTSQTAWILEFLPPHVWPIPLAEPPPFCASCRAVNLDAGAVDEQAVGHTFGSGQRAEDVLPFAALGPAHEPVAE